jgi:thioredoxin 1
MEEMVMAEGMLSVGDDTFKAEVLDSATPVIVDFWAPWCMPCRAITPVLENLAKDYVGKVKFVKMNVDDHQRVASEYSVRAIPTLLVFKAGKMVDALTGGMASKQKIEESIKKIAA